MWRIWVDTGGTFTDAVALDARGRLHRAKVLSSSALRGRVVEAVGPAELVVETGRPLPADFIRGFGFRLLDREHDPVAVAGHDPAARRLRLSRPLASLPAPGAGFEVQSADEAPVLAARLLAGSTAGAPPLESMRLGTTLGTNALLERRGVPTALFMTRGLGDLLRIGTQQRPELFALEIVKPPPLYRCVVEVGGRIDATGEEIEPLDLQGAIDSARRLLEDGVRVAAVALMHAYRDPTHESRLETALLELGFEHVSRSSALAPAAKLLPRAQTAVVDAYLAPVVRSYLDRVRRGSGGARLHVMTSAGGLVAADAFRPKDSLLSGPAGGVVGAARAGRRSGFDRVLAFDMGGTSTDVARVDRDFEYRFEQRVGDAELLAPALAIESVASGGGSICWFDGQRLRVGPRSAGARPGPACYGAGGPLTLTDVNLLCGRLDPARFGIPIDESAARKAFEGLCGSMTAGDGPPESILDGLRAIADETMADAIRRVSLRRGYDPSDYALVAFGGAGGQHACAVATRLGVKTVIVPADAGLLSALGLGHAVVERFAERQVLRRLDGLANEPRDWIRALEREAIEAVVSEGVAPDEVGVRRRIALLRFEGQDSTLEIEAGPSAEAMRRTFVARYRDLYGHRPEGRAVELESLRVVASSRRGEAQPDPVAEAEPDADVPSTRRAWFDGRWREVPLHDRGRLRTGAVADGPALIFEAHTATVVEPGWTFEKDHAGALILRSVSRHSRTATSEHPEAVRLELFTNRFRRIAREMGERMRQTSVSTNVKERMDFSCALLDADGELVVNAPHIPVHLGAIGLCVRELARRIAMEPGDVVVTNHPGFGGSHLPDVTVVTPVFADDRLLGYVASRAHHAEIGGTRPGSMPPAATRLIEEGVVIAPRRLVRRGEADWQAIREVLIGGRFPTRALEDNLADLRAAVAANHAGARALEKLADEHGAGTVRRYMARLKAVAEARIRDALSRMPDGLYRAGETLDDGTPLAVTIDLRGDGALLDFAGSGPVHPGSLNATPAIVHSAVIYVLRLMIREPLPLNEGLLRAVEIRIPPGILNPGFADDPAEAPAVVGGNVETSQRLVDTLLKALGLAACSQGTMNNVIFGGERFGYYETVCGGCGAGPGFDGADAVHSHMTNTRITDPEIVELRYPVRVERFAIRRGSGGRGRHRGGDGAVRELTFLAPVSLSLLTQHRTVAPYGMQGGRPGKPGAQRLIRAGGEVVELRPIDGAEVEAGDRLVLETPGGGGWGPGD